MLKHIGYIFEDIIDVFVDRVIPGIRAVRKYIQRGIDSYQQGELQTFLTEHLKYTSWLLLVIAMFFISTIAHYIGIQTLQQEFFILVLLVAARYAARVGL